MTDCCKTHALDALKIGVGGAILEWLTRFFTLARFGCDMVPGLVPWADGFRAILLGAVCPVASDFCLDVLALWLVCLRHVGRPLLFLGDSVCQKSIEDR